MYKKIFVEVTAILFVLLFIYAATTKLVDAEKFRIQLGQSPMLAPYAGWIAWVIPLLEILIALLLMFERTKLSALYAAFFLMVMFTVYIVAITKFSTYIPCSCGGVLQDMTWNQHLIFNIAFVLMAVISILWFQRQEQKRLQHSNQDISGLELKMN